MTDYFWIFFVAETFASETFAVGYFLEGDAFFCYLTVQLTFVLTECYVSFVVNSSVVPHGRPKCLVVSTGKANSTMVLFGISLNILGALCYIKKLDP